MSARVPEPERRIVLAVASRLLQYPDDEFPGQLPLLRDAVRGVAPAAGQPLLRCIERLARSPLLELQADYVATFDLRRRNCLYLTYHLNGDTRRRGTALWRLRQVYRDHGYSVAAGELPDFLPALLELAAETGVEEPLDLLLEHQAAIGVLGDALEEARSPYADVIAALQAALPPPSRAVREAIRQLESEGPPAELVGIEGPDLPVAVEPTAEGSTAGASVPGAATGARRPAAAPGMRS